MPRPPSWRLLLPILALAATIGEAHAQSRTANLSSRAQVGSGANIMISGFVIGPGAGETVLIRAVGPTLGSYGVTGTLPDPVLSLFPGGTSTPIATNSAWPSSAASAMAAVGAFALPVGSKDAAILTSLAPGAYTAQVLGASGDSGQALLEVYEVGPTASSSRLLNLSTRVNIGTGTSIGITGLVISGASGARTLLIRGVGPTLTGLGVPGALADPVLTVLGPGNAPVASNDNWGTPVGAGAATGATLTAAATQAGAFALGAGSKDAAVIATVPPGNYSIQVSGSGGTTGIAIIEVYDLTPASGTTVSVAATQPIASASPNTPGQFMVTRSGDTSQALAVAYSVGGTASPGVDYRALSGVATIPAGASSAPIAVTALSSASASSALTLTLNASAAYGVVGAGATVSITSTPPTLYVANLAPTTDALTSTASGTATIYLAPDGSQATINISFTNLSSAEQAPHLTVGVPGSSSNFVFNLSYPGQVVNDVWTFTSTGSYSSADLIAALKNGNVYVEIGSTTYPTAELSGQFIQSNGSRTFTAPAAPPAIDLSKPTSADASRFLAQATFGPTLSDINSVVASGYSQWISTQMALPPTSHLSATRADAAMFPNTGVYPVVQANRQAAWWKIATTAPDQLRQRVAFALSEILVTSDASAGLANQAEALANYYDILVRGAFGTFRQLLEDVTLSPVMGNYLNMLRNQPANPAKGTNADENYAREIMQLFTVGLNQLNPDGTLKLDAAGQPIPTYDNSTIVQTANLLTGWAYRSTAANPSFLGAAADWYNPMMLYPAFHDNTQKTLISGVVAPPNQGGAADLKMLLDALANHPNTGPFIVRELIQRLVTSNPSPGYVYRVSQVFADNGSGARGDLGAVVKAILLDYEARSSVLVSNTGYGKLKEPLLRQTAIYRAFNASSQNGRFAIVNADQTLSQAAMRSPTVFNFFLPSFVPPGSMAAAGLTAPEFQITTASTAISTPNTLYNSIYTSATPAASTLVLDLSSLTSADNTTMVGTLNLLFAGNHLSAAATQRIIAALNALPASATALDRARAALELVVTAPGGAVQQ